jgi:hypothetical protein
MMEKLLWSLILSGYRAASVIGFIESSGRTPVLINEDYTGAALVNGLNIVTG